MRIVENILIALGALRVNRMRSFLTMLGIIIGVAAVITMVSVSSGARQKVESQINSLGTNMLMIFPGAGRFRGRTIGAGTTQPFTEADVEALRSQLPMVVGAAGSLNANGQVISGNINWQSQIRGIGFDYLFVRDWVLRDGRGFTQREVKSSAKVALLGATVARELFGAGDPVGQRIRIKKTPFEVIGVLASKGQSSFGSDQDDIVMVPLSTARSRLIGQSGLVSKNVRSMFVKVAPNEDMAAAEESIRNLLRLRRHIPPGGTDDFNVRNLTEFLNARAEMQNTLGLLLAAAAGISLVVGGIGIMNIMLVSVTERTREIGLRLAVGARNRDILLQFLIEAVTLCLIGGLIGIALGIGAAMLISEIADWPTLIGFDSIVLAAAFSALVGVFFGYYPARKAARLNPIEALRFD